MYVARQRFFYSKYPHHKDNVFLAKPLQFGEYIFFGEIEFRYNDPAN